MSRSTAERLDKLGIPNNIFTRTAYWAIHRTLYIILYTSITIAAIILRKDRVDILNSLSNKLFGEDAVPTQ